MSNLAPDITPAPLAFRLSEKNLRLRIRLICALTGAWGVATGYALFILISQRAEQTRGATAFIHFFAVLFVAVLVVSLTEWFRDTIRGEVPHSATRRSLGAILSSVLLLAVFEVCVLAYEEVSQATFESPYAVKELTSSVSAKENSYAFFRPGDILNPFELVKKLKDGRTDTSTPAEWVAYSFSPEIQWTLFPDNAPRPPWHDAFTNRIYQYDPILVNRRVIASPTAAPAILSLKQSDDLAALRRKLYILSGHDAIRLQSDSSFADVAPDPQHNFYHDFDPNYRPCLPSELTCEPPESDSLPALSNITTRNISETHLRNLLTVELNNLIRSPAFYQDDVFRKTGLPDGIKQLLNHHRVDSRDYQDVIDQLRTASALPASEHREDVCAELRDQRDLLASRLLPLPRVVQLNRELLVAAFPKLLAAAPYRFDERTANLAVLALLWMCAGAVLGWILAGAVFDASGPGEHPSRRGALRGLGAALGAAPALVVLYVVLVRLLILIRHTYLFRHELHYLWKSNTFPPDDLFNSSLIPLLLRLDSYWNHKWWTLSIFVALALVLAVCWFLFGRRRAISFPRRALYFSASLFVLLLVALVFDSNLPFVYLLVAFVWITPAIFLGICAPKLRTGSPMPQIWGIIAVAAGLALVLLTILRLKWDTISLWLLIPGIVLVATGLVIRAGLRLEEYWPLGALALGLVVCGMSALVQQATFLGVLSDVHELNAYSGYGIKLVAPLGLVPNGPIRPEDDPNNDAYIPTAPHGGNPASLVPAGPPADPGLDISESSYNDGPPAAAPTSPAKPDSSTPSKPHEPASYGDDVTGNSSNGKDSAQAPTTPAYTPYHRDPYDDYFGDLNPQPTREEMLHQSLKDRIDYLRRAAQGRVSTGDLSLDEIVHNLEKEDNQRLHENRSEVARRLELSIVGSLGFWLTVGLLAAWALRRNLASGL